MCSVHWADTPRSSAADQIRRVNRHVSLWGAASVDLSEFHMFLPSPLLPPCSSRYVD